MILSPPARSGRLPVGAKRATLLPMAGHSLTIEDRVTVPDTAFDHDGYREWVVTQPPGVRTTYVCGEVLVEMSPESLETHNQVKLAVTLGLGLFVRDHDLGVVYPDGALVTHEGAGVSAEPDLTFVSWAAFDDGRVRLQPRAGDAADFIEIVGSPDLVVEIVSDGSVGKDTRLLRAAYASAGIREYWLIDARGADIVFDILVNRHGTFEASAASDGAPVSNVLGGRWRLTRHTNRAGRSAYRLDREDDTV
jgi:Uma2 family endonuclease